jgi:predicted transcriptional regulator
MKYRPDILIIRDILNSIDEDGTTISLIVNRAKIPHDRLKNKISQMMKSGLVIELNDGGKRKYFLTDRGKHAKIRINEMIIFLKELGFIDYIGDNSSVNRSSR